MTGQMPSRVRGMVAWGDRRFDPLIAGALTCLGIALGIPEWTGSGLVFFDGACLVAVCVLLWWRRRFPISVAIGAGALLAISYLNSAGPGVSDRAVTYPAAAAAFLIGLALGAEVAWLRSLFGLVPLTVGLAITGGQFNPFLISITIGPWLIGLTLASRQRAAAQLARRARELAEEREVFATASVRYERARIARELHDIVAHSVSLMVVQANAGAVLAGTDQGGAEEAFEAISETAVQARAEIDRLASLLSTTEPVQPVGLEVVDELVHRAQSAGLRVTYSVSGDVEGQLTTGRAEAIHRVVQESITNALKHAPGAEITVRLHGQGEAVEMTVHNSKSPDMVPAPASGLQSTGGGHGIAGMRERVVRDGGTFQAGPDPDGGWQVSVQLPRRAQVLAP